MNAKNLQQYDEIIDLSSNEFLFPYPFSLESIKNSISLKLLSKYNQNPELKNVLATFHQLKATQEPYLFSGSEQALIHSFSSYKITRPNGSILLPEIGWEYYSTICNRFSIAHQYYKITKNTNSFITPLETIASISKESPKLIIINSPANPTGHTITHSNLKTFLDKVSEDSLVILDENYYYLSNPQLDPIKLTEKYPHFAVIRSMSKTYGIPGVRIGYMICGQTIKSHLNLDQDYLGFPILSEIIGLTCLDHESQFKELALKIEEEREILFKFFNNSTPFKPYSSKANFLLVDLGENAKKYNLYLLHNNIKVKLLSNSNLKNHIRISIAPSGIMEKVRRLTLKFLEEASVFNSSSNLQQSKANIK